MERDMTQLCADWINEKGGITVKGEKYKIELAVEDNKMSPAGSVDAATKLVYEDKVQFIGGTVVPVQAMAVSSVTEKNKVLFVISRTDIVHPDQPYTFTGNYGFAAPVPFLYEVLLEKYPSVKSMGYLVEDEDGARAVYGLSSSIAKQRGLKLMEPESHPWEAPEYYPQWTKIISTNPDAVDQGLKMPDSTANCLKQGRELGYKGPIIAAIPGDPNLIIQMVGDKSLATDFIYAGFDPYAPDNPPMIKEMIKRWEAKYKTPMDADAPEAWDWMYCLTQAIEKAQSLDTTDVKNAWENMTTIETSKGTAKMGGAKTFGINHMVFNPCTISQFKDGKVAYTKWVDPWIP
jgi:branched-chain amino acid transport system substrate-binding protein